MSSKHHINSQAKSSPAGSDLENPMAAQPDGKSTNEQRPSYLDIPFQSTFARASDTFSASDRSSRKSSDDHGNDVRTSDFLSVPGHLRSRSQSPAPNPPRPWKRKCMELWAKNKGLILVIISQFFGVMMNVTTRLLEMDGHHGSGLHPFQVGSIRPCLLVLVCPTERLAQILFARMTGTLILTSGYQWLAKVEHAPFGPRSVWGLLVARGVGGFFGVYGMYYSLQYLPLSDATVITFLAPLVTGLACSVLINEPFTRSEQVAGLVSFLGVILIARPTSLLPHADGRSDLSSGSGIDGGIASANASTTVDPQGLGHVTPVQRMSAVGVALIGVLGAACAYTTIRWIGQRAHPLISVNYFAAWSTIVSTVCLLAIPGLGFRLPASLVQWAYLIFLGVCGFVMQFLLTAGLAHERGSRATNMVYTQMLFALAFDKIVWNTSPGLLSILGSSLILGSALYVAVHKNKTQESPVTERRGDEQIDLMSEEDVEANSEGPNERERPLRGVHEVQLRTLRV
ncbi:MAG: hypothetical protein OHK93_006584 [Ramalina farinacea]|uniref:EamA domain-containing protein n=1 Tax=Ramalina farinacea TaxID=258253 RepID=A0AA43QIX6_9LECA|nr:hypothetical protein [Ramalina farinacea]